MASNSQPYGSSADLYPPIRHSQYDPNTYHHPSSSVDYLGGNSQSASQSQLNLAQQQQYHQSPLMASQSDARYGEKYSDGIDGPPEAMLASHSGRGYRDASSAGKTGFFANKRKRNWIIAAVILLIAIIVAAVVGGVVAARNSSSFSSSSNSGIGSSNSDGGNGNSGSNSKDAIENSALTGTNGSTITMENGQSFTYINNFGGHWVSTPFDDSAKAQSWSPALNETWDYTNMKCV